MSQIFPFVRDSEDYAFAYSCLQILLTACLLTWTQLCIPDEIISLIHLFHLFTMYFMRTYYVPVISAWSQKIRRDFFHHYSGVLLCQGPWVGSEIAYVINQSYSYSYWWFLTNRNIYGSRRDHLEDEFDKLFI